MTTEEPLPPEPDEAEDLPPCDLPAERALLGALLGTGMRHDEHGDTAAVVSRLPVDALYRPVHRSIYAAMLALHDAGEAADPVSVAAELQRRGELTRCGGPVLLATLMAESPTATNVRHWLDLILDCAARRAIIEAGQSLAQQGASRSAEVAELVDRARARLDALTSADEQGGADLASLADDRVAAYDEPVAPGLPTGLYDLDRILTGGMRPGQLIVVAARPGIGKSLVATYLALEAARRGRGALLVSLEMSRDEITDRVLANVGSIELTHLTEHQLTPDDWRRVEDARKRVQDWPLRIEDGMVATLSQIRALATLRARQPAGLALLVVDYLQLMTSGRRAESRQQEVAEMSRGLKLLSRELGVPIVALSQLNRGPEHRSDKRPTMADLRDSGAIEQDADKILLLWQDEDEGAGTLSVDVAKNRNGRTGQVVLGFAPYYAQVRSLAAEG